jgi:transposase
MRTAIPRLTAHADELTQRLQHDHDGHTKPRRQMLSLLASRQAQSRQQVARLLGVQRNTIGRWLARYAAGDLEALLQTYVPAGKPVSLAPAVLASLEQALRRPEGFPS